MKESSNTSTELPDRPRMSRFSENYQSPVLFIRRLNRLVRRIHTMLCKDVGHLKWHAPIARHQCPEAEQNC
jgi:hypothetical protein